MGSKDEKKKASHSIGSSNGRGVLLVGCGGGEKGPEEDVAGQEEVEEVEEEVVEQGEAELGEEIVLGDFNQF